MHNRCHLQSLYGFCQGFWYIVAIACRVSVKHLSVCCLQVCSMLYPLYALSSCDTLQQCAEALYTGETGMITACRPVIAGMTARGGVSGGLLWASNPAYLLVREARLYWDGLRRGVRWGQRSSAAVVSRTFSPGERGPQTRQEALAEADELQTLRTNCLAYAVQRFARGQPPLVKVAPMLDCVEHGTARLFESFTAGTNCSPECNAVCAAGSQLHSSPKHVLDHGPSGMVSRLVMPTDYDGWSRPRLLAAFGTLLPDYVSAAVDEVPAVRAAIAAGRVLADQRQVNNTAETRRLEIAQDAAIGSCRCTVLDALRLRCFAFQLHAQHSCSCSSANFPEHTGAGVPRRACCHRRVTCSLCVAACHEVNMLQPCVHDV